MFNVFGDVITYRGRDIAIFAGKVPPSLRDAAQRDIQGTGQDEVDEAYNEGIDDGKAEGITMALAEFTPKLKAMKDAIEAMGRLVAANYDKAVSAEDYDKQLSEIKDAMDAIDKTADTLDLA